MRRAGTLPATAAARWGRAPDQPTARWLADFATGLTCELGGAVHRVDRWVFLLSPADAYRSELAGAGEPLCTDVLKSCHHGSAVDGADPRPAE